jgi:glycosyltransferase involved in cell wall biosynthesis
MIMRLSIITIFRLGDIEDLASTINSVIQQTFQPFQHLLVISNVDDDRKLLEDLNYNSGTYFLNEDRSLYDAMNIGLSHAEGDVVYFLNGGDHFNSVSATEVILQKMTSGVDGILFRTIQHYKNDGYIRPKMKNLDSMRIFPAHQGFVAKLEIAKKHKFADSEYSINADLVWMQCLLKESNVIVCPEIIAIFSLGGVSNRPSLATCKRRTIESGLGKGVKEFCKLFLYKLLRCRLYYRILYSRKYDYIDLQT